MSSLRVTKLVHIFISGFLQKDFLIIDATAGNGFDFEFLLNKLEGTGFIYGIDIQQEAIDSTKEKIKETTYNNYSLIKDSHEYINKVINKEHLQKINLIIFNLGYLPLGDKTITTTSKSTIKAIENSLEILSPSGIIIVTCYIGHTEGVIETNSLITYLKKNNLSYFKIKKENSKNAPFVLLINK